MYSNNISMIYALILLLVRLVLPNFALKPYSKLIVELIFIFSGVWGCCLTFPNSSTPLFTSLSKILNICNRNIILCRTIKLFLILKHRCGLIVVLINGVCGFASHPQTHKLLYFTLAPHVFSLIPRRIEFR